MSTNLKTFTPRLTAPSKDSKYYTNYKYGGYCTCIVMDSKGYVMPNCVGYAQGRLLEEQNITKVDWKLPACNAEDWYERAQKNGLSVGATPKLGSVIVWGKGKLHTPSDGCGHVAVVEEIAEDGTITVSESGYKTFMFKTEKFKPPYVLKGYTLLGFVYPYCEFSNGNTNTPKVEPTTNEVWHTVKPNESLWSIAQQYYGSGRLYTKIFNANHLTSTIIRPNQKLLIPPM